jgi:dTMP kinase
MRRSADFSGKLFVVEGIDGSGKSTQMHLLQTWLESQGYSTFFSEWNSSDLVRRATKRGKQRQLLTPLTFSLIHATDFADRTERNIVPPLKAGAAVLADRYAFTAFARDVARGCHPEWVRELYSFSVQPAVALYFRVPLDVALDRILKGRPALKWYEAGQDMGWSDDPYESFRIFQGKILEQYEAMIPEFGFQVVDATLPIPEQQDRVREIVKPHLANLLQRPDGHSGE